MNINENNFYPLYITDTKMIEKFNEEKIKKNFHAIVKNQNVKNYIGIALQMENIL